MRLIDRLLNRRRAAPERVFTGHGHVDVLDINCVGGWATGVAGDQVSVEVLLNGVSQGTTPCLVDRKDVEEAGFKRQSGFRFGLSGVLDLSRDNLVHVRPVGFETFLPGPTLITRKFSPKQMRKDGFALAYPLFVATAYSYEIDGGVAVVTGEIKSSGADPTAMQVISGGRLIAFEFHPVKADSFLQAFGIKVYSYSAKFELLAGPCLQFEFKNPYKSGIRSICAIPGIGSPSSFAPSVDSRRRVVGDITINSYITLAYTSAALLWSLVDGEGKTGAWLDWGCGPGRTIIPLQRVFAKSWHLLGCDIDEYNINVLKHLDQDIPALVNELDPPLPYHDDTFDVVHGISVLTHLTEENQKLWVNELARILKPNGLALLTTHGELALLMSGVFGAESIYPTFIREGNSDEMLGDALGSTFKDRHYYRATFQTNGHARNLFKRRFDVARYIAGGYHNHQDLWILRRR